MTVFSPCHYLIPIHRLGSAVTDGVTIIPTAIEPRCPMSYATITIGDLLADVNRRYFLPAIQRPYVWSADQVVTLIDSLLKGYPISSLMFWAVGEDLKRELKIYNFLEHWKPGMQNPTASANGRDVTLVLDGQQRITSLLIALRGSFAEKAKHKRRASPDAWSKKNALYRFAR